MAREYPRFLYSNPQNTKSPGPFVIYTLEPLLIFRVAFSKNETENYHSIHTGFIGLVLLNYKKENPIPDSVIEVMFRAVVWLEKQIEENAIDLKKSTIINNIINRK